MTDDPIDKASGVEMDYNRETLGQLWHTLQCPISENKEIGLIGACTCV